MITVTGHRGAAGLEPENTLRSFRRALDLGADAVETDVRLTRDGQLVCFHDENLSRLTGHPALLSDMTLEDLQRLDVGQGERIPTLLEALNVVRGRAVLEIELKSEETVQPVLDTLKAERVAPSEITLISFHPTALRKVNQLRPDLFLGLLLARIPPDALDYALSLGAAMINPYFRAVTPEVIWQAHDAGLQLRTWTVNDPEDMHNVMDLGVDGITTDRPDILLNIYEALKEGNG